MHYLSKNNLISSGKSEKGIYYRRYTDGFLEQWGTIPGTSAEITAAITFPIPFKDTGYTIVGGLLPGDPTKDYEHLNFKDIRPTGFTFRSFDAYGVKWYACGYE